MAWLAKLAAIATASAVIAASSAETANQGTLSVRPSRDTLTFGVGRDLRHGIPHGHSHSLGVSHIVRTAADPSSWVQVRVELAAGGTLERSVQAGEDGLVVIALDRIPEAGDRITVMAGQRAGTLTVPDMAVRIYTETGVAVGHGPPNVVDLRQGSPHSLELAFGNVSHALRTGPDGRFQTTFKAGQVQPSALGTLRYVSPSGSFVNRPVVAVDPFARGDAGDGWADVVLGQPDFGQIAFNEVVANRLNNPGGILVDRHAQPGRVYIYDGGNNRVLGFDHLGSCGAGPAAGSRCTADGDCPNASCIIDSMRDADIVLGQTDMAGALCNGDSNFQAYPDVPVAGPGSLCTLREEQVSPSEGGSMATMDVDRDGNLYVPDFFNNRILRYDDPFSNDTNADAVWGQADFLGTTCNRGWGYNRATADSLCLASPPGRGEIKAGVTVDATGSLWVADNYNHRVLRFPFVAAVGRADSTADLVLGQTSFTTRTSGQGLHQLAHPMAVRLDSRGRVFVADSMNARVLRFDPPFRSGMTASAVLTEVHDPTGLEIGPDGSLWVNDTPKLLRFTDAGLRQTIDPADGRAWGGVGIDGDGNLLVAGWDLQMMERIRAPDYRETDQLLRADDVGIFNKTGSRGLAGGKGIEVTDEQLIVGDGTRLLYWNEPDRLRNHQEADGVVGAPDFVTRERWGNVYERLRADGRGRLWALWGTDWGSTSVLAYDLPLVSGAEPVGRLNPPLPVLGGGEIDWSARLILGGIEVDPDCDCLWLSDTDKHRAFRIRDASTQPIVDIVLGQTSVDSQACNRGRGEEQPSADSVCHPGGLGFDPHGNLWLADHNLEFNGNHRLLMYAAEDLPRRPARAVFGIPASRVLGRGGDFTADRCPSFALDPLCAPFEPSFDARGDMLLGFNAYLGPRFPMLYRDPTRASQPFRALGDFHSMPTTYRFSASGDLFVQDHNRARILVYKDPAAAYPAPEPKPLPTPVFMPIAVKASTHQPDPGVITIGNAARLREVVSFEAGGFVESATFAPHDARVLAWSGARGVRVVDWMAGTTLADWPAHDRQTHRVAFSPDGMRIYTGGVDDGGGRVRAWDWLAGRELWSRRASDPGFGVAVAISPDGRWLGTSGPTAAVWRLAADGAEVHIQLGWSGLPDFAPTGEVATWQDGVRVLRLDGTELRRLDAPSASGFSPEVAWSPDGRLIASGGWDGTVFIWRASDGRVLHRLTGHTAFVQAFGFSPDGTVLASSAEDATVRLWNVSDGHNLAVLTAHTRRVTGAEFSPDGRWLVTAGLDGQVRVWGVERP